MMRQRDQFLGRYPIFLVSLMRMSADRKIDARIALGDRAQPIDALHPRRDCNDTLDVGRLRARHHGIELIGIIGKIEVAVTVDEHQLLAAGSVGSI